jgi:hypothetical protein
MDDIAVQHDQVVVLVPLRNRDVNTDWGTTGHDVVFGDSDGPVFNRAEARNNAAKTALTQGDPDVLVFADACISMPSAESVIASASRMVLEHPRSVVHCHDQLIYLDEHGDVLRINPRRTPGGVIAVHRDLYLDVRGYDERFSIWGGEDNAFVWACQSLGDGKRLSVTETALHVWHQRDRKIADQRILALLGSYRQAKSNPDRMREVIQR